LLRHYKIRLPGGNFAGFIAPSVEEEPLQLQGFCGIIEIVSDLSEGFLLLDQGEIAAAYFKDQTGNFKSLEADRRIDALPPDAWTTSRLALYSYTPGELEEALNQCRREGLLLTAKQPEKALRVRRPWSEQDLERILSLPGVLAVSTFNDGFSVQSLGDGDPDQLAAVAEDLLRAGSRVVEELRTGRLDQVILESGSRKLILVPREDLHIAILTGGDVNLGLIRIALRRLQQNED
jgi:predicted regulator of Ras-like GTPase activity (Roadblock/LC7/MglB family)